MAQEPYSRLGSLTSIRKTRTENLYLQRSSLTGSQNVLGIGTKSPSVSSLGYSQLNLKGNYTTNEKLTQKPSFISTKNVLLEPRSAGHLSSRLDKPLLENSWLKRKQSEIVASPSVSQKRFHQEKTFERQLSTSSAHALDENDVPKYKLETFMDTTLSPPDETFSLRNQNEEEHNVWKKQNELKANFLSTVSTSLVNRPAFKNKNDSTRLSLMSQATAISKFDPEFILKVALYTRQELNIRTTANFLLALAANCDECKNYLKKYYSASVRLPSDWIEIAELYQTFEDKKVKTSSVPSMLRKEMVEKFSSFDEYQLAKYNKKKKHKPKSKKDKKVPQNIEMDDLTRTASVIEDDSVIPCETEDPELEQKAFTLKRLIRLLHINSPHYEVMALLGKRYPSTAEEFRLSGLPGIWDANKLGSRLKLAVPVTWETQLAEKGNTATAWQELLDSKKLPYMAMLRNLCNLLRANISAEHNKIVINLLSNKAKVEKSRQFPLAFFNAYKSVLEMENIQDNLDSKLSALKIKKASLYAAAGQGKTDAVNRIVYLKKLKKRLKNLNFYALRCYKEALEKAIGIAVEKNVNPVPGRTLVICDLLSLSGAKKMREESVLLSVMCICTCEECDLKVTHCGGLENVNIEDQSILANVNTILNKFSDVEDENEPAAFYGSHFRIQMEHYLDSNVVRDKQLDNIILLTQGEKFEKTQGPKIIKSFLWKYRNLVNPRLLYVQVDISGKIRSSSPDSPLDVHLSGASDQLLRFLAENGSEAQLAYVESIDKTYKLKPMPKTLLPAEAPEQSFSQVDTLEPSKWKTVRVFISSTFRDMHGERDILVRYVFPELRARCRAHRLHVQEVDLRWGITQEDTDNKRSLELCLSEVSRCHMFVGILGERYGAIPTSSNFPSDARFSWVHEYPSGASVTELEMYVGALADPKVVQKQAFFFIRDGSFQSVVPDDFQADFRSENGESEKRLSELKERIRKSGLEVFDGYPCYWGGNVSGVPIVLGLEAFGQRVLDNLWNCIQKCFLTSESETENLSMALHNPVDVVPVNFVGRDNLVETCKSLLDSSTLEVLLITGKMGSGKTAFLEHLKDDVLKNDCFICDIGESAKFQVITEVYRHFWIQVSARLRLQYLLPKQKETLTSVFWRVMNAAAEKSPNKRIVLIFDGVDQLKTVQEQTLSWLPVNQNKSIKIIVSASEGSPSHRTLLSKTVSKIAVVSLPAINLGDRKSLVSSILSQHGKVLSEDPFDNQMMQLVTKRDAGYPQYLNMACTELRRFGLFENLSQKVHSLPQTIPQLILESISNLEEYFGRDLIQSALSFIALSREGLEEVELHFLLSICFNSSVTDMDLSDIKSMFLHLPPNKMMSPLQFATLARSLKDFLIGTEISNEDYVYKTTSMEIQKVVRSHYIVKTSKKTVFRYHKILAGLFLSEADPSSKQKWQGCSARVIRSLPYHLMASHCFPELSSALCSLQFLMATIYTESAHSLYEEISSFISDMQNDISASHFCNDNRIQEYIKFLKKIMFIPRMSYSLLVQQALCEPQSSSVFKDAMYLKKDFNVFLLTDDLPQGSCQRTITGFPSDLLCVASDIVRERLVAGCSDGSCLLFDEPSGRVLNTYMGHSLAVTAVCFVGPNLICTSSLDGTLSLWNSEAGYRVSVLSGHQRRVSSCCAESDGKTLVSAGWDNSIRIWNVRDGRELSVLDNKCPINCVAHHPTQTLVASGDWKGKIKLWDLQLLTRKSVFHGHTVSVISLVFNEDGNLLASGALNGDIILWSLVSGTQISKPGRHLNSVRDLAFSSSNLVTAATEGTLKVWSNHWGTTNWSKHVLAGHIKAVKMLSDLYVAVGCDDGTMIIYNIEGAILYTENIGESVTCIAAFHSGSSDNINGIIVGTLSGHVKLSEKTSNNTFSNFVNLDCYFHPVSSLHSLRCCIYIGFHSGHFAFIYISPPKTISSPLTQAHESSVTSTSVLSNKRIVTTGNDKKLKIWYPDLRHGKLIFVKTLTNCHDDWITCSAFAHSEQLLVTGSQDTTLKVWDLNTESTRHHLSGLNEPIANVQILDDKIICTGSCGSLGVWTMSGSLVTLIKSPHKEAVIASCSFKKDLLEKQDKNLNIVGYMVTVEENKSFALRDLFTLSMSKQLVGHTQPVSGCSTLFLNRIISTSLDRSLKWWSLEETSPFAEPSSYREIHEGNRITAVDISANILRCLSADSAGTVVIWKLHSFKLTYLSHIRHPNSFISRAVFSNDFGTTLAYPIQTQSEKKLVYSVESKEIISVEKESPLLHQITCMDYSSQYNSFICGDRNGFLRIDNSNGSSTFQLDKDWILMAKYHPREKEKYYLAKPNGSVHLSTVAYADQLAGKIVAPLPAKANSFITALDVSETELYVGQTDGNIRIASKTGEKTFHAHSDTVSSVIVSGQDLFTASADGTIKVWNRRTLAQTGEFFCNISVTAMSVSPTKRPKREVFYGTAGGHVHLLIWTPKSK